MPDALGSILGGALGTTTVALYLESAAGISAGGRTGLTSVVVFCFIFARSIFYTLCLFNPGFCNSTCPDFGRCDDVAHMESFAMG